GLHGASGAGDAAGALRAYQRTLELQRAALKLVPAHPRALRGYVILQMKAGNLRAETEPYAARRVYEEALRAWDRMPQAARDSIGARRIRGLISVRLGRLLPEIGAASDALPFLDQARAIFGSLIPLDPNDARLRYDLATADFYRAEALRSLGRKVDARDSYLAVAKALDALLAQVPDNAVWLSHRSQSLLDAGRLAAELGERARGEDLIRRGLEGVLQVAGNAAASPNDLYRAATGLLVTGGDAARALEFAQAAVNKTNAGNALYVFTLARAQQRAGQWEAARQSARQALALLPAPEAGDPAPPLRRSLENLLQQLP
ncbi:MAG TPA: hypothetical protein DEH78_24650, partial [Solibacterales bacterium]|nr:hypothetical protein [Bryobacterales bacterium]